MSRYTRRYRPYRKPSGDIDPAVATLMIFLTIVVLLVCFFPVSKETSFVSNRTWRNTVSIKYNYSCGDDSTCTETLVTYVTRGEYPERPYHAQVLSYPPECFFRVCYQERGSTLTVHYINGRSMSTSLNDWLNRYDGQECVLRLSLLKIVVSDQCGKSIGR